MKTGIKQEQPLAPLEKENDVLCLAPYLLLPFDTLTQVLGIIAQRGAGKAIRQPCSWKRW